MEATLQQLLKGAATAGEDIRRKTIVALQNAAASLETPDDTLHRLAHMNLQSASVQVGINMGLFKLLSNASGPVDVATLAEQTKAEPQLVARLLRYLNAIGVVSESGKGLYAANHVTRNLTEKVVEAGMAHYFGLISPQYQYLPELLKDTGYKVPVDETKTAFHKAFRTELDPFSWFAQNPSYLADFHAYHALRRQPDTTWISEYPVETEAAGWPANEPLYVNVGGGVGHQCAQFKEKYPTLGGRIILQDLPHSVAAALPTPGVENMAHNMFEPQPVTGAKFYHLRAVFHNHPPHRALHLLKTLKAAMKPESVLLIDEMVLPEEGVNYMASSIDMTILSAFASMERTEAQWRELVESVGLKLVKTYRYSPLTYESVMDVRLQ